MRVCLASTSPARLMLLQQFGIRPLTIAPDVDEEAVIAAVEAAEERTLTPEEHVLLLARRKAADVAVRLADDIPDFDGIVIGGDSMFALNGRVLGKPHTAENARARWIEMRGETGVLHSGHAVVRLSPGIAPQEVHAVAEASVTFASDITDAEIDVYVTSGEPLHVAGAFTVDSLGGAFITRVEGDPSTVVGMSVSTLRALVRELDVDWTSLWGTIDPSVASSPLHDSDASDTAPL
jgi:septum formation protein